MSDFNPQSSDAMFSQIIQRLDQQDAQTLLNRSEVQTKLDSVLAETRGLGERVQSLEDDRWWQRGVVATIGVIVVMIWEWVKAHWPK